MPVLLCGDIELQGLTALLSRYDMMVEIVADEEEIPGSFWKTPEAGLIKNILYVRADTPVHSALHEACHYICMDEARRRDLDTDAGGGYEEEDGVCYLQVLLSDFIPEMKRDRMFSDMDEWGYSFRLGSSRVWFEDDAEDAHSWLTRHDIIDSEESPTWNYRH